MDAGLLQLSGKTYFRRCERQTHLLFIFLLIRENRMSFYEENKALSLEQIKISLYTYREYTGGLNLKGDI